MMVLELLFEGKENECLRMQEKNEYYDSAIEGIGNKISEKANLPVSTKKQELWRKEAQLKMKNFYPTIQRNLNMVKIA